jgi:18S rRNA (adenine1779-N6/adenine1780-N6)-dimethyltransferase
MIDLHLFFFQLSAAFMQTTTLSVLEKNYRIHLSMLNQPIPDDLDVKGIVNEVLDSIKFKEKRARTMDIDDFMKLLHAFNSKGIHFT